MLDKFSFAAGCRSRTIFRICNIIFFILVSMVMLVPILKVVSDSFDEKAGYALTLWPTEFTASAYQKVFTDKELLNPLLVSIFTTAVGTAICLFLTATSAYVLLQTDMPGHKLLTWMFFITMIFSGGMVPGYLLIKNLHLMNTLWSCILPPALSVAYIILMKSFFQSLPQSLMEAASIDGCTPFGVFIKIVLPLSKPALASIGLFIGVKYWNQFFNFVMYITNDNLFNFQVKLRDIVLNSTDLQNSNMGDSALMSKTIQNACVIVSMIPPLIAYPFCQKYFTTGVTLGAVKG
jgi:putative aldouronate transport system permease protein